MQRRLDERGARLLIAPWPLFVGLERGYPFAPVHDDDPPLLPGGAHPAPRPAAGLRGPSPRPSLWVHPVDHHPNEIAHRLAAEALVPEVLKLAPP